MISFFSFILKTFYQARLWVYLLFTHVRVRFCSDMVTSSDVRTTVMNLYLITILEGKIPRMGGGVGMDGWTGGKEFGYSSLCFWGYGSLRVWEGGKGVFGIHVGMFVEGLSESENNDVMMLLCFVRSNCFIDVHFRHSFPFKGDGLILICSIAGSLLVLPSCM